MVKEIEKAGIPVVQMANLIPVAKSVGANRIVPTVAIPYPVGNPEKGEKEFTLRESLLERALEALSTEVNGPTMF